MGWNKSYYNKTGKNYEVEKRKVRVGGLIKISILGSTLLILIILAIIMVIKGIILPRI